MSIAGFGLLGGLGAIGSILGGSQAASGARDQAEAQIQAGREARADYSASTDEGMFRALLAALGPQQARQYISALLPADRAGRLLGRPAADANFTDEQRTRLAEIDRQLSQPYTHGSGGTYAARSGQSTRGNGRGQAVDDRAAYEETQGRLQQERETLMRAAGYDPGQTGVFDSQAIDAMGPGFIGEMEQMAERFRGQGADELGRYDQETGGLMAGARRLENNARAYGSGRAEQINRQADQAMTGASRQIQSRLAGSGLAGSTALSGEIAGAGRQIFEGQQGALNDLGDRQTQLVTGLGQNRLAMQDSRSRGRTATSLGLQDRDLQLSSAPLSTRTQMLTGATFNPMLGQDTTRYYPGVSPGGASASTWGNALGAMGGQAMNYGMMGLMAQDPAFQQMYGGR